MATEFVKFVVVGSSARIALPMIPDKVAITERRAGTRPRRFMPSASFVYQKKTKVREGADICEIKCKRLACEIQVCISKIPLTKSRVSGAVVDHSKCQPDIDRYNRCCEAAKKALAEQEARTGGAA